jgi:uncharacterized membrane protein YbhN (UPF0104 family)
VDNLYRHIAIGVVLGVIVYAGMAAWGDLQAIGGHAQSFPVEVFAGALALTLVNYGLRFAKWHWYLGHLDIEVPVVQSATVFIAGMVMAITPGKVGEVLKSFLLEASDDIAVEETAPIVVAERLTDLLGLAAMGGLGAITFAYGQWVFGGTLAVLFAGILVVQRESWAYWVIDRIGVVPILGGIREKLETAYKSMKSLVGWRILAGTTLLSIVAWSMEGVALYWLLWGTGSTEATMFSAFFAYALATVAGAVSFVPGGLGVAEGSLIGVLLFLGVIPSQSLAAFITYLIRFATLWFGVGLGVVALVVYRATYID